MENLEIGDVVRLVSGGPEMTVLNPSSMSGVECGWFPQYHTMVDLRDKGPWTVANWGDAMQNGHFPAEALLLVRKRKVEGEKA